MEQDEVTVCRILAAVRKALPAAVSVSAKIRLPTSDDLLVERIPRLIDAGIDFLTVHGRTLHENKTKVKACHGDRIRLAIETASKYKPGFPIVANGGVEHTEDVSRIRRETGAVAVMSSEALLERPNVFAVDSSEFTPRQVLDQQFQFARDYLSWCQLYPPLPGVVGNSHGSFNIVKGHLFKFLHRYLQEHFDMRDRLTDHKINTLADAEDFLDDLYARCDDEEMVGMENSMASTSWYRRHWSANARVHQREVLVSSNLLATGNAVPALSVEQRKLLAKEKIAKLKAQRLEKQINQ
jgi:tRNA-dihydrouridine synthase